MRPSLRDQNLANRCTAGHTGLAFASVSLVTHLKPASPALGVDVIRNRRAPQRDRFTQYFANGLVEFRRSSRAQAGGGGQGMDSRGEQALVRVDVPESGQEFLVQQQRLDPSLPPKP